MADFHMGKNFLNQLNEVVEKNISNENFGVTELADAMSMSRSNLLRKVKKETGLSVNQLLRDVRLKRAMQLLQSNSLNVSEVSFQVGFSSASYFIKCFRERYGFPPGEVGKQPIDKINTAATPSRRRRIMIGLAILATAIIVSLLFYTKLTFKQPLERSIAILPFKNESTDSSNIYLINGVMESTLNNLQKIKMLKVISRTSSEKYRYQRKSIPEMANELNVNYVVEGSGQKIGDQILLNIQLIEAHSDKHLWAKQYRREAKDIFALQQEVAKNIAQEVEAIVTPAEQNRIEKKSTENLQAYDQFLKGREILYGNVGKNLANSIPYYEKAIELDTKFAQAYAELAMVYYYLDEFQTEKKYRVEIGNYADKAELFDAKLDESLVAKALYYLIRKEFDHAIPYLEKALEYNPNSGLAVHFLTEIYNLHAPNTAKYLEYALIGLRLNVAADSVGKSYYFMHLSNALIQTGFVDEAMKYINLSLQYNPKNSFSTWIKAGILYARDRDINQTKQILVDAVQADSSLFYLIPEIAKMSYLQRNYQLAYQELKRFIAFREDQKLDIFQNEDLMIGIVLDKVGKKIESLTYVEKFKKYAEKDKSIYRNLSLMMYYTWKADNEKALLHLKLFSKEDNIQYWVLLLPEDCVVENIKNLPMFKKIMTEINEHFWDNHKRIRYELKEKGLL
ncbi:MAG: helix-turn-helix domain-containing protein [Bacteroidetes bacterium]|nr:helix-turn-helix domain-containing protein [Bacteroidota bacterium]